MRYVQQIGAFVISTALLFSVHAEAAGVESAHVLLPGTDEAAVEVLAGFLQRMGFEVFSRQGAVGAKKDGFVVIFEPKVEMRLKMIVATSIIELRDEPGTAEKAMGSATRLHKVTNGVKYSVQDGAFVFQIPITFVDRLERAEIEEAFTFMKVVHAAALLLAPELLPLLKR